MRAKFFVFFITFLFISCNMSDMHYKIFDGYSFVHEGADTKFIFGNGKIIPPNVVEYKHDRFFLIVRQEPDLDFFIQKKTNEILGHMESGDILINGHSVRLTRDWNENVKQARQVAQDILKDDSAYLKSKTNSSLYWILVRDSDELFGPLTKDEFNHSVKEMNISIEFSND